MSKSDRPRAASIRQSDARSSRRRMSLRPVAEDLEGRLLLANFPVTVATDNPTNPDPQSLRGAILASNAAPGATNTITFNIPGTGVQTISLAADLPTITVPVVINGYSQPGASANTLAVGDNAKLLIQLDGTNADVGFDIAAGGTTVEGLVINRVQGDAIQLRTLGSDVISGNFIGTDPTGTSNSVTVGTTTVSTVNKGNGVAILDPTADTVGGSAPAARNIISGNKGNGVAIDQNDTGGSGGGGAGNAAPTNNVVQNNYIGTDASGTKSPNSQAPSNGHGIRIARSPGNMILGNVISNSQADGLEIAFMGTDNNVLQGNMIGTDVTGSAALGNGANGIFIQNGVTHTTIGGTTPAEANVIAGNGQNGVELVGADGAVPTELNVVEGDFIGTNAMNNALGNGGVGVYISSLNNTVGGTIPHTSNVIAFNKQGGVKIDDGVLPSTGNAILSNTIVGNSGPGITTSGQVSGNVLAFNIVQANAGGIEFSGSGQQISVIFHNALIGNNAAGGVSGIGMIGVGGISNTFILSNAFTQQTEASLVLVGSGSATSGVVVNNNTIAGDAAMILTNLSNTQIASNVITNSASSGIIGIGPLSGLTITANTITGAKGDGMIFADTAAGGLTSSSIGANTVNANAVVGIVLIGASGNVFQGNVVMNNGQFGILVLSPSAGNGLVANVVVGNGVLDVYDATIGPFPGGTANAWAQNRIGKSFPAGLP